jgi:hypothetical protein
MKPIEAIAAGTTAERGQVDCCEELIQGCSKAGAPHRSPVALGALLVTLHVDVTLSRVCRFNSLVLLGLGKVEQCY